MHYNTHMEDVAYKPLDVATILGCSVQQVYKLINANSIPALNMGAGKRATWVIRKTDLERFISSRLNINQEEKVAPVQEGQIVEDTNVG